MLNRTIYWLWEQLWPFNWAGLYAWMGDTLQKIGIVGVALGLYQDSPVGLLLGGLLLGASALIVLAKRSK